MTTFADERATTGFRLPVGWIRRSPIAVLAAASIAVAGCAPSAELTSSNDVTPTREVSETADATTDVAPTTESTALAITPPTRPPQSTTVVTSQTGRVRSDPPYVVPVAEAATASWADTHAGYPATDVFVPGGCGGIVVSPVDGVLLEVRTVDKWDEEVDNPATRGGRSVTIIGDDGTRYYLAHLDMIESAVVVGARVITGQRIGTFGETGRTSACHLHFAISPPCPDKEWSVRRGVIWPFQYLDAWRAGEPLSPSEEVQQWLADNPTACDEASADPFAGDS